MFSPKAAHIISVGIGMLFVVLALYLALYVRKSYFYTSFTLGSWLILDFIDYKLTNSSILSFFYNHKYQHAFFLLFVISFFACFTVDFIWGVQILKMWEWVNYTVIDFVRMYLFMNISFVLSMYEMYRVIQTLLKPYVSNENLLSLRAPYNRKRIVYVGVLLVGIVFLISPLYLTVFKQYTLAEYLLFFPFLSITFITDSITYFTDGKPVLEQLIRLNLLKVLSVLCTVVFAFIITEGLNFFGREWEYLRMPFPAIRIFTVPLSVLVGWIPLVIGLISMVNMVKHLTYLTAKR